MRLEEITKCLVAKDARSRVAVCAPAHSTGRWFSCVSKEDVDGAILAREVSLVVNRYVEEALQPVRLFQPQLKYNHLIISRQLSAASALVGASVLRQLGRDQPEHRRPRSTSSRHP